MWDLLQHKVAISGKYIKIFESVAGNQKTEVEDKINMLM